MRARIRDTCLYVVRLELMGCGASSPSVAYALQPEQQPPQAPTEASRQTQPESQRARGRETDTARATESCFNLLEKESLLRICGFLPPRELRAMARVSRRFSEQMDWLSSTATGEAPALRSVVEQAARQWVRCADKFVLLPPIRFLIQTLTESARHAGAAAAGGRAGARRSGLGERGVLAAPYARDPLPTSVSALA